MGRLFGTWLPVLIEISGKRCTSTGRKCDGYEFPRELKPPPSASFPGTAQERRLFHRFQVCTVPAFAGGSETGFWRSLVLKVGLEEPVIRNAIFALGSLHEDYQNRAGRYSKALIQEPSHRRAVKLYGDALRQLNTELNNRNQKNAKLAIIASILFTCFEVLRRNNMAAVVHYSAGMRELLRQIKLGANNVTSGEPIPDTGLPPQVRERPQTELDDMLRVFARYDIQACTFTKPKAVPLDSELALVPPAKFTLPDARRHLDNLLISVYQFVKSDLGMYRYWDANLVPLTWRVRRDEAVVTFEQWLNALEGYLENAGPRPLANEVKSLLGLRLQVKVAIIMLKTCIDCSPESTFDQFTEAFEDIVSRVERMTTSLALVEAKPLDNDTTPFTMELGIIHPLFFVATKCRHPTLRRRAITQLRKAGREGVWEGPIVALLCDRIVQIEETGVSIADGEPVPELNRLHDIQKNVEYETQQVLWQATYSLDETFSHFGMIREIIFF